MLRSFYLASVNFCKLGRSTFKLHHLSTVKIQLKFCGADLRLVCPSNLNLKNLTIFMYFSQLTENFGEIAGAAVLVGLCIPTLILASKPRRLENRGRLKQYCMLLRHRCL